MYLDGYIGSAMAGVYLVLGFAEYIAGPAVLFDLYQFPLTHRRTSASIFTCPWPSKVWKSHLESKLPRSFRCHLSSPGFGFGVACLGISGGSWKSPGPLRYLVLFWMQVTPSTLYLIYVIKAGPPWNTYHNSVKKKTKTQTQQLIFSFGQRIWQSNYVSLYVSWTYVICGIFLECFVSGGTFQMWTWVKDHKTIDIG